MISWGSCAIGLVDGGWGRVARPRPCKAVSAIRDPSSFGDRGWQRQIRRGGSRSYEPVEVGGCSPQGSGGLRSTPRPRPPSSSGRSATPKKRASANDDRVASFMSVKAESAAPPSLGSTRLRGKCAASMAQSSWAESSAASPPGRSPSDLPSRPQVVSRSHSFLGASCVDRQFVVERLSEASVLLTPRPPATVAPGT